MAYHTRSATAAALGNVHDAQERETLHGEIHESEENLRIDARTSTSNHGEWSQNISNLGSQYDGAEQTPRSSLSLTRDLIEKAKLLGLEGRELREFVIESEKEEHERQREIRRQEVQLEHARIQASNTNNNANANPSVVDDSFKPKLPFFQDGDDLESYLFQFEQFAATNRWKEEDKAFRLSTLLKGKARMTYAKMKPEDAQDYKILKETLLESFQLSADAYREKFRRTRKNPHETYKEYVTKMEMYLDRWIDLSGKGESVKEIKDLLVQEQILETLPVDLAIHIGEKQPSSAGELAAIATTYEAARNRVKRSNHNAGTHIKKSHVNSNEKTTKENSQSQKSNWQNTKMDSQIKRCFLCKESGHFRDKCPKNRERVGVVTQMDGDSKEKNTHERLCEVCEKKKFKEISKVRVEGQLVDALRDSGCTSIIVDEKIVPKDKYTGKTKETMYANKALKEKLPVAKVHIDSPYFEGETDVIVMKNASYPVLIGQHCNVGGEKRKVPLFPVRDIDMNLSASVTTRAQSKAEHSPEPQATNTSRENSQFSHEKLKNEQQKDPSLVKLHKLAKEKTVYNESVSFTYKNEILYRVFTDKQGKSGTQLVVPKTMRGIVLATAHDLPLAGHQGQKKTRERVWSEFFWPGMSADIRRYCSSCDVCQRTSPRGKLTRVPMGHTPVIDTAFRRVAVDIVGPIKPMSETGKQYILVMIDYATRYPEAVALRDIRASTVADALMEMWSRLGIPDQILTDNGSQFTGSLMQEINDFLKIKSIKTTPWHPQTNGLVEKFNGTLKNMLRKLVIEQPKTWDKVIPALLFAYREVPQESTGFSPFEMLYGRTVKGPMSILRQTWTEEKPDSELQTTVEYVYNLRNRIEETCKIAKENVMKASKRQAKFYNRHAKMREFTPGTKVLLLLPVKRNKLEISWQGPFEVLEKINQFDYKIKMTKTTKIFHINLLKQYQEREEEEETSKQTGEESRRGSKKSETQSDEEEVNVEEVDGKELDRTLLVVEEDSTACGSSFNSADTQSIPLLQTSRKEDAKNVQFSQELTSQQVEEARKICLEFNQNLTDVPMTTNLETCTIETSQDKPVFVRPRPIPHAMVKKVEDEIDDMLKLGVIEPAASPYNSPIVLVTKKDGESIRFCSDLRELNKVTVFDAEPITDVEHLFASLNKARYFSKLDLTKGYWAIPIAEEDRDKTAFTTSKGQFRWKNMPFGLKTAGSVFNRMMRKLLQPLNREDVYHFMDDILIATETWEQHMDALRAVFQRLEQANLAAKPSKCFIGFSKLPYLGHEIGGGNIWPEEEKINKIRDANPPQTKKELRSFLGLTGFYRQYIPDYSTVAAPLTDKTKKDEPEKVKWNETCQEAFNELKRRLCQKPVLCMPDYDLEFILRTDASDCGLGAILMQEQGNGLQPIAYASKKLSETEQRYATVEKECFATVWGVKKFERFLYGKHFILETDHQPLRYLQRLKPNNPRLMRWSLQLQPYSFTIRVIPGKDNIGADYLSRTS